MHVFFAEFERWTAIWSDVPLSFLVVSFSSGVEDPLAVSFAALRRFLILALLADAGRSREAAPVAPLPLLILALLADAGRSREVAPVAPLPLLNLVSFADAERFLGVLLVASRRPPILA
nr:unnamed protein product [Haemonchus contortus]